ncbi:MAG: FdhF/YdeP family oxidoreductase [Bdellovibrionales bacterium]|nr:FdhF/YdeP family oxidoreductase [Bdellovibrionales bacterium]
MKESQYPPKEDELDRLDLKPKKDFAGGWDAVNSSLKTLKKNKAILRGIPASLKMNQKQGFDCPGCAWPDPDEERAMVEFCENGIKALAEEATSRKIGRDFFQQHTLQELSQMSDYELSQLGRLSEPLYKSKGELKYKSIDWNVAFEKIGKKLNSLSNPDEAIFYTSGRTSNEAAFLYQLFARKLGTNNLPDCSNMCHESSGVGLSETIGIGKGTVKLQDFEKADCIIVMGQNPGTNHPRMLSTLQRAVRQGVKIISVNPLREAGTESFCHPQEVAGVLGHKTQLSSIHLPIRINGDVALLKAWQKLLLDKEHERGGVLDLQFIQNKTIGFTEFKDHLHHVEWSQILSSCGLSREQIEEAFQVLLKSKNIIVCWAMGLTQHKNAVANIQEVVNLLLMRGQLGRPGSGVCPVRGHSNVQGDRTMGIIENPPADLIEGLEREFVFTAPKKSGYNVVHSLQAMHEGVAKVFVAMGGNLLSASPDTEYTAEAFRRCDLTVQISTKLNRGHLVTGEEAMILPCLSRSERDRQKTGFQKVSVENSMGIVHSSQGGLDPISDQLKSEVSIVCGLAKSTLNEDWSGFEEDYSRVRDKIEKVIPGFEDYNIRLEKPEGFYLPNGVRDSQSFVTTSNKAHFTIHDIPKWDLREEQFLMMTIRTHDQFNTTIYGLNDRYRGVFGGRRVVFMNSQDMVKLDLDTYDEVNLLSRYDQIERVVERFKVVPYEIPKQCVATYFPEANALVPWDLYADKSHTPVSKSVVVEIQRK